MKGEQIRMVCTVNGRVDSQIGTDYYTCVKGRGKSVVDYMQVPHINIETCLDFRVCFMSDSLAKYKLHTLISTKCRPLDHSVLLLIFSVGCTVDSMLSEEISDTNQGRFDTGRRMYYFDKVPEVFQNNDMWRVAVSSMNN